MKNIIREKFYFKCDKIFEGLTESKNQILNTIGEKLKVKKGKILFKEGSTPKGVYMLKKGQVKIYQLNPAGKFQIVYIYTKGDYFGFRPILCNTYNSVSAEAMDDCDLVFYPKKEFLHVLNTSQIVTRNLLFSISYEFNVWVNRMSSFSHKSVKERVALGLLILHEKFKKNEDDVKVVIPIGREDLASLSGTTIETAVRILTKLKNEKIISVDGKKIKIMNYNELLTLADIN